MEVFGVVYLVWNTLNGMKYVGQTTCTVEKRFKEHAYSKKSLIGRAIQKYRKENFRYGVIKTCASKAEMDYWEKYFIVALRTKKPFGYNMTDGGEGTVGLERTPEHCAKIAAAKTGKHVSNDTKAKLSALNLGKHLSAETRAKIGAAERGIPKSPECCKKISVAQRGDSPFKNLIVELDTRLITYSSLAKLIDLSYTSISKKIKGTVRFTCKDKIKLVELFGLPIEYLLQRDDS